MPIGLSPNATIEVYLDSDAPTPKAKRPTLVYWYMTGDEFSELYRLRREIMDVSEDSEQEERLHELLYQAASIALSGWRNVRDRKGKEIKYKEGARPTFLRYEEVREIISKVVAENLPKAIDQKN